ncbi:MAG: gluconate 2-dehydrogenase subunit 3 family protein [Betaproteobacteria bacterium]|nr:MAG: gluconate 2-dehydrogenase subunit 3 family protein [Betaproteobacteria bacterium]
MTESELISRREAILRVTALLGGVTLIGGEALLTGCRTDRAPNTDAPFTPAEVAFLDEVADTILPETSTPGAKAVQTGAFMATMVRDGYDERDRKVFRDGMRAIDDATRKAYNVDFMRATPQQRLAVLESIDRDQKSYMDARRSEQRTKSLSWLKGEQAQEAAPGAEAGAATAVTQDKPAHYFRMMKELALLGYFTSEIGSTKALRYIESPGRYDPCTPYTPGEPAWAPHA